MKYGYMCGFRADLATEIAFAKENFDFLELTIMPALFTSIDILIPQLKEAIGEFEVLGHLHWDIIKTEDIKKNLEVLKSLGAKKITVHPFQDLSLEENIKLFNEINGMMRERDLFLMIENVSKPPFNDAAFIKKLLDEISGAGLTLDVGHANQINQLDKFIELFKNKTSHIHLHDNQGDMDHAFYLDETRLNEAIAKIKAFGYDGTILMETFSVIINGQNISQDFPALRKLHVEQLEKLKNK